MTEEPKKLTPEEKKAIVREFMLKFPDTNTFRYNKKIIDYVEKHIGVTLTDTNVSRIIKRIEDEFSKSTQMIMTKNKLIDLHISLYQVALKNKKVTDAIRVLREIGKLEGHYIERIKTDTFNFNVNDISKEDEERLRKEFDFLTKKSGENNERNNKTEDKSTTRTD
jgi:hypothetical protein